MLTAKRPPQRLFNFLVHNMMPHIQYLLKEMLDDHNHSQSWQGNLENNFDLAGLLVGPAEGRASQ